METQTVNKSSNLQCLNNQMINLSTVAVQIPLKWLSDPLTAAAPDLWMSFLTKKQSCAKVSGTILILILGYHWWGVRLVPNSFYSMATADVHSESQRSVFTSNIYQHMVWPPHASDLNIPSQLGFRLSWRESLNPQKSFGESSKMFGTTLTTQKRKSLKSSFFFFLFLHFYEENEK